MMTLDNVVLQGTHGYTVPKRRSTNAISRHQETFAVLYRYWGLGDIPKRVISDDIVRIDGIRYFSRYHNTQVSAIDRVVFNGVVVRSSITILVIWFDSISKKPAKTSSSFANP